MAAAIEDQPTSLYRLYDYTGRLLNAGISNNPDFRLYEQHAKEKAWWPEVDHLRTRIVWLPNRRTAFAAELEAIRGESPIYNVVGVKGRPAVQLSRGLGPATTVRLTEGLRLAVANFAVGMGITKNAALTVLVAEGLELRRSADQLAQ